MSRKTLRSPKQARKARQKAARLVFLYLFLGALMVGGLLYLFSRPLFRIQTIEVSGARRVPEDRIKSLVEQSLSGTYFGFLPKAHTLLYPKTRIKESLLKEFPVLSGVSITLQNLAALRVAVREREPKALWCADMRRCFLVDEAGFAFATPEEGTEGKYYRLQRLATSSPLGTVVINPTELEHLLSFFSSLEDMQLSPETTFLSDDGDVEVVLQEGMRMFVRKEEYVRALLNLKTLLGEHDLLPKRNDSLTVDYLDLRFGNKIYFKPK